MTHTRKNQVSSSVTSSKSLVSNIFLPCSAEFSSRAIMGIASGASAVHTTLAMAASAHTTTSLYPMVDILLYSAV
jgi:hypothetical protein